MSKIKTGDHPIVDNWVNNIGPETSKSAIKQYIPAIADFCKNYQEMIKPDSKQMEKGKRCLYAVSGGEIQYIPSEK